jgi:hypothetical protein
MDKVIKEAHASTSADLEGSNSSDVPPAQYDNLPPGTVLLESRTVNTGHGGDGHVLLQPTPSRDPNDPLNWSNGR